MPHISSAKSHAKKSLLNLKEQDKARFFFDDKEDYELKLKSLQFELVKWQQRVHKNNEKVILVFEGPDAAGKGGAIKRITEHLDPRGIETHSIGAPNAFEKQEHYLERFFRHLPKPGKITIFDRSWYGRLLVERVEEFATPKQWKRAFEEINQFEKLLTDDNIKIYKFFLDISWQEQGERFKERQKNPFKAWKLTTEDYRNRKKWNKYYLAFKDMLKKTHTKNSPWNLIPADSKWFARYQVIHTLLKRTKLNKKSIRILPG